MTENLIEIKGLTKDYGDGKGIFDVNFELRRGEILGFVGANGAGKTTTIRSIMGFIKPDGGTVKVFGKDAWIDAEKTKPYIGYVPGEIAFPDLSSGTEFLKSQAEFLGLNDLSYANYITEKLQLDPSANLKRMSKGMKQKTAVVAALMSEPAILILDEPTTGLDPLMRVEFLELMLEEKKRGKTILISSHLYEELEKIADRVALIDRGKILTIVDMRDIRERKVADFKVEFNNEKDYEAFKKLDYNFIRDQKEYNQLTVNIEKTHIQALFSDLKNYDVKFISEVKYTLEKCFAEAIKNQKENG
nr:ATP-binding cassette domain-containing protein [Clostridia bacterium]